jgi:hypothetical protein
MAALQDNAEEETVLKNPAKGIPPADTCDAHMPPAPAASTPPPAVGGLAVPGFPALVASTSAASQQVVVSFFLAANSKLIVTAGPASHTDARVSRGVTNPSMSRGKQLWG